MLSEKSDAEKTDIRKAAEHMANVICGQAASIEEWVNAYGQLGDNFAELHRQSLATKRELGVKENECAGLYRQRNADLETIAQLTRERDEARQERDDARAIQGDLGREIVRERREYADAVKETGELREVRARLIADRDRLQGELANLTEHLDAERESHEVTRRQSGRYYGDLVIALRAQSSEGQLREAVAALATEYTNRGCALDWLEVTKAMRRILAAHPAQSLADGEQPFPELDKLVKRWDGGNRTARDCARELNAAIGVLTSKTSPSEGDIASAGDGSGSRVAPSGEESGRSEEKAGDCSQCGTYERCPVHLEGPWHREALKGARDYNDACADRKRLQSETESLCARVENAVTEFQRFYRADSDGHSESRRLGDALACINRMRAALLALTSDQPPGEGKSSTEAAGDSPKAGHTSEATYDPKAPLTLDVESFLAEGRNPEPSPTPDLVERVCGRLEEHLGNAIIAQRKSAFRDAIRIVREEAAKGGAK